MEEINDITNNDIYDIIDMSDIEDDEEDFLLYDPKKIRLGKYPWGESIIKKLPLSFKYKDVTIPKGNNFCSICLEEYQENDIIRCLNCHKTHHFHSSCILEWLKTKTTCPLCRNISLYNPLPKWIPRQKFPIRIMKEIQIIQEWNNPDLVIQVYPTLPCLFIEKKSEVRFLVQFPEFPMESPYHSHTYYIKTNTVIKGYAMSLIPWNPSYSIKKYIQETINLVLNK